MGGSILPVGMVWNYIGGIGIELDRCSQYNLGSTGGIQQSLDSLSKKDLIEKNYGTGVWTVVDPIFKNWLIKMSL